MSEKQLKRGRPALSDSKLRKPLLVGLRDDEKAILLDAAGGKPLATWMRETCLAAAKRPRRKQSA